MVEYFASHVAAKIKASYSGEGRRIRYITFFSTLYEFSSYFRCLEHITNLATQAFLKAYSKSKFYNPAFPDDDLVAVSGKHRDVIGLVRAIVVKVGVPHYYVYSHTH